MEQERQPTQIKRIGLCSRCIFSNKSSTGKDFNISVIIIISDLWLDPMYIGWRTMGYEGPVIGFNYFLIALDETWDIFQPGNS